MISDIDVENNLEEFWKIGYRVFKLRYRRCSAAKELCCDELKCGELPCTIANICGNNEKIKN